MDLKIETNRPALTGQTVSLGTLFAVIKFFILVTVMCNNLLAADRLGILESNSSVRMLITQEPKFILEYSPQVLPPFIRMYSGIFIWCVSCTNAWVCACVCFATCGCFGNMCTYFYCVLYCLYCVLCSFVHVYFIPIFFMY